eukprot:5959019-Amphidinium_carterae.1
MGMPFATAHTLLGACPRAQQLLSCPCSSRSCRQQRSPPKLSSKKEALLANPNLGVTEQSKGISRGVMVFMMVSAAGGCSQPAFIPENVKIN